MVKDSSYPGHRPSMMAKRNVGMTTVTTGNQNRDDAPPGFVESTILGASKKINRLINPNFNYDNLNKQKEENEGQHLFHECKNIVFIARWGTTMY
jgi:hypothetical protein